MILIIHYSFCSLTSHIMIMIVCFIRIMLLKKKCIPGNDDLPNSSEEGYKANQAKIKIYCETLMKSDVADAFYRIF